jgi:hypothetical protein
MVIKDIIPKQIAIQLELTLDEVDAISLALSKSCITVETDDDRTAQDTLLRFSEMLNSILDKCNVPELQGK